MQSLRLFGQARVWIRWLHYSLSTEKTSLDWIRFYVSWQDRNGTTTHPRDMGARQVDGFLTMLAIERKVSASAHNKASSALLFLYRGVLEEDSP